MRLSCRVGSSSCPARCSCHPLPGPRWVPSSRLQSPPTPTVPGGPPEPGPVLIPTQALSKKPVLVETLLCRFPNPRGKELRAHFAQTSSGAGAGSGRPAARRQPQAEAAMELGRRVLRKRSTGVRARWPHPGPLARPAVVGVGVCPALEPPAPEHRGLLMSLLSPLRPSGSALG